MLAASGLRGSHTLLKLEVAVVPLRVRPSQYCATREPLCANAASTND
jgi:hypothetical protein